MRHERSRYWCALVVGGGVMLIGAGAAQGAAVQIGLGAFTGGETVESFEGFTPGPNITFAGGGYLEPGVVSAFDFGSGVSLTDPIPNPGIGTGVIIGDWSIGSASFGLSTNGSISSAANVPFGSAYIAVDDPGKSMAFTFDTPQDRVGAFVTGTPGRISIEAFDSGGGSLGSASVSAVHVSLWNTNFLGLEVLTGIKSVRFSGDFEVLDNLMFETSSTSEAVIPLSTPLGMGLAGIGLVVANRRRRWRKGGTIS